MTEPVSDRIVRSISIASEQYHRLVLVVALAGSGKTASLQDVHARTQAPIINVNLELSKRMLDLTERQRVLKLPLLLDEIAIDTASDVVLLDNIEILFDVTLHQDPLRLLQGISRNRTVVASWNGTIEKDNLVYAKPDHQEYRRYPTTDLLIVAPEVVA